MADKLLDVRGMSCPRPILATKKQLAQLPKGGTLEILTTDPGSVEDMASFCRTTGNELLESTKEGEFFRFVIKHV